jgi:hypothetical protein
MMEHATSMYKQLCLRRLLLFLIGTAAAAIVEHPAWSRRPLSDGIPGSGYGLTGGSLVRKFMSRMGQKRPKLLRLPVAESTTGAQATLCHERSLVRQKERGMFCGSSGRWGNPDFGAPSADAPRQPG